MRSISKIQMNDKSVTIKYVSHNTTKGGDVRNTTRTIKSEVRPHIKFFEKFQEMKSFSIAYMELSVFKNEIDKAMLANFVVTSIGITEDTDCTKVTVSMTRTLANGRNYSMTSPMIDLTDDEFTELEALNTCFDDLVSEAESYLEGKNGEEQLEIKFDAEEIAA